MQVMAPATPTSATPPTSAYWFPAKRYGWGWGKPATWQGWAVLLGFCGLQLAGLRVFDLPAQALGFVLWTAVLSAVLLVICWRTGEPPKWRWGTR